MHRASHEGGLLQGAAGFFGAVGGAAGADSAAGAEGFGSCTPVSGAGASEEGASPDFRPSAVRMRSAFARAASASAERPIRSYTRASFDQVSCCTALASTERRR
ncbi:MAG: hypothetical protein ACK559_00290, partial [bacterium]